MGEENHFSRSDRKKHEDKRSNLLKRKREKPSKGDCQDCALILSFDLGGLRDFYQKATGSQSPSNISALAQNPSGWVAAEGWFAFTPFPLHFNSLGLLKDQLCECLEFQVKLLHCPGHHRERQPQDKDNWEWRNPICCEGERREDQSHWLLGWEITIFHYCSSSLSSSRGYLVIHTLRLSVQQIEKVLLADQDH